MSQGAELVRHCEMAFHAVPGLRKIAVTEDHGAFDIACLASSELSAVVRCVDHATAEDHTALATMISQGDFVWGAVVYNQGEAPSSPGLIESFHVSQLDQLVARLNELREACGEAG